MEGSNEDVVKQPENNNKRLTGFQLHPECINRKGRPKKPYSLTDTLREIIDAEPRIKQNLIVAALDLAMKGDAQMLRVIWSYLDGAPPIKVEHEGEVTHIVTYDRLLKIINGDSDVFDGETSEERSALPEKSE